MATRLPGQDDNPEITAPGVTPANPRAAAATTLPREMEALHQSILQTAMDGYCLLDATGHIREVNPALVKMSGFSAEELLRMHITELQAAETPADTASHMQQIMQQGSDRFESRHRRKDGSEHDIEISTQYWPHEGGWFVSFLRDITEQKRAQEALRRSEENFRQLTEKATTGICVVQDGRFVYINPFLAQQGGYSPEEVAAQPDVRHFIHPDDLGPLAQRLREAASTGATASGMTYRGRRKDGSYGYLETHAAAIEYQGRPALLVTLVDISARKQAELALAQSEEKFRLLTEKALVGIYIIQDGMVVYVNPTLAKIGGYAADEIAGGMSIDSLMDPGDFERVSDEMRALLEHGGNVESAVYQVKRKDGAPLWLEVHGTSVEYQGRPAVMGTVMDVTERWQLEQEYRHAQKMEAIGRLAGGVAHDFNNMISVILGYASMVMSALAPSDPLREDVQEIVKAGQRSAELTRQLLAFARKQTSAPRPINLNQAIGQSEKMLRRLIGENIEFQFSPAANLWTVNMDPSQLDQVLANLAVNSRDAIADVGRISVQTANVVLDQSFCIRHPGSAPGPYVRITFSDTGCGMDALTLERIFEPFFTTKPTGEGTGLGLPTVYGIVKQHGGFLEVASKPGEGTTFRLFVPRFEADLECQPATESALIPKGTETILIVEDDEPILRLYQRVLETNGYRVLATTYPEQAIALAETHPGPIHLLITDVVMPIMNGVELRARIETVKAGILALFVSGYAPEIIANLGILSQEEWFLHKPFLSEDLLRKVREMLDQQP